METSSPPSLSEVARPAFSAAVSHDPPSRNAPFFIVGCGRSGTTLLRVIMLGHSRLHISPETHFIRRLVRNVPLDRPLSPDQVEAAVDRIVTHPRWQYMEMSDEEFRAEAMALASPRLADVLELIYRRHLQGTGKARFGDKTPDYVRIVPQLLSIWPEARFINLIRDGHDVAISFASKPGWGHAYDGPRFEWTRAVRATLAYRQAPFADRILEVRYEELVTDLEGTVRRICAFLGEAFEPGMLGWHGRLDLLFPGESPDLHPKLFEPIRPDAVAAWRGKLSAIECFLIEASLHRDLASAGYDLRFAHPAWRPFLVATGAIMRQLAPLLDRAVPALLRRGLLPRPLHI
jgi:hypothetical protein